MKKRILSVLCAAAMLLSSAGMTAFAESAYKKAVEADFDTIVAGFGNLTLESDKIAAEDDGNKYLASTSYYNLAYIKGNVIIDVRARFDKSNYDFGTITTRDGGSGKTWERTTEVRIPNTGWYYFRIIYDFENKSITTYRSQNGWSDLQKLSLTTNINNDTSGTAPAGMAAIKFDRLEVDDIMIYQNGTAPTANVNVTRDGLVLTANYTYSDAEGDAEGATAIKWQSSADGKVYEDVADAAAATYTLTENDSGKYIRCVVTPKSTRYPDIGADAVSNVIECGKVKVYKEYINEDFEGTEYDFTLNGTLAADTENTSKYLVPAGQQQDITNLKIDADETVIEVRAKGVDLGSTNNYGKWFWINVIGDKAWTKTVGYAVDSGADSWRYYRMVITAGETAPIVKTYASADRTAWIETSKGTVSGNLSEIVQIRFKGCAIDDVKIYQNGTAPIASDVNIRRSGDVLSAGFTYADAEGDGMSAVKYQWQRSGDGVSYEDIEGAATDEYELGYSDFGKYVRVQVIPVSSSYPTDGEPAVSEASLIDTFTANKFGAIEYVLDGNNLTVSAGVKAVTDGTAMLFAAAYSGTTLEKVFMPESISVITASTAKVEESFDISEVGAGTEIKLMMWQDMTSMTPAADSVAFTK